jgi:hypothetical protein
MNYNAPGAQVRGIVAAITSSQLVVIDNRVPSVFIPNLDAEFIDPTASINLAINRRKQEPVYAATVYGTGAFVLRTWSAYHQPLVIGRMKV